MRGCAPILVAMLLLLSSPLATAGSAGLSLQEPQAQPTCFNTNNRIESRFKACVFVENRHCHLDFLKRLARAVDSVLRNIPQEAL